MARDADFVARFHLAYTYKRSTGPVIGRFLTSLREGRLEGVRTASGEVLVPARAYDPRDGRATTDAWVDVGPEGTITTWTWIDAPAAGAPLDAPFAWALVRLDGADTPMLHAVRGPRAAIATGARVRAVFADHREGGIRDLSCFEVIP